MKSLLLIAAITVNWSAVGSEREHADNRPVNTFINQMDYSACATTTAMTNVPAISHHTDHKSHSSVGVGLGSCEGSSAAAVGFNHHREDTAIKLTIGKSGGVTAVGGGISWSFP